MRGYSLGGSLKSIIDYVYTVFFWPGARLIRSPIMIRNKGNIVYGKNFTVGRFCRLNAGKNGKLTIGENCVIGDQCQIEAMEEVKLGSNVLLASKVYIGDASHGDYHDNKDSTPNIPPNERPIITSPIVIGDNVWIGNGVSILPGVRIGNGTVIGANAVVTGFIPDESIAVGNPAKVIKRFNHNSQKWEKTEQEETLK